MKHTIYLDHAATTGVRREVLQAMLPYFSEHPGNPSALYELGEHNQRAIQRSRQTIAAHLRAKPEEIYFTSGGSEADNWVLKCTAEKSNLEHPHIITTGVEHHAVLNSCRYLEDIGCRVTYLIPDSDGLIHPNQILNAVTPETCLISVMFANNEIGTIQPIRRIAELARSLGIPMHTDAVQVLGHIPIHLDRLPVTYLSASAHKLGGPKGCGMLFIRSDSPLPPFIHGGAQEQGIRAGTENVPGIVGFSAALSCMERNMEARSQRIRQMRDEFAQSILQEIPEAAINGTMKYRLPGNLNVRFRGINAGKMVHLLDREGICVSAGAACSARDAAPSHVLLAIGLTMDQARSSIRFTIGEENTRAELRYTVQVLKRLIRCKEAALRP